MSDKAVQLLEHFRISVITVEPDTAVPDMDEPSVDMAQEAVAGSIHAGTLKPFYISNGTQSCRSPLAYSAFE